MDEATLELLRLRPQQTSLNLFIFEPTPVLKCQINDPSITKGAREISFDTITLGSYADTLAGMTVLVGTTDGGEEVGRVRLRSCIVDKMTVGENSNIKWEDGLYLTVLRYWEVWPIYPRIIQNPNNPLDVIFYKDYDIPHTSQNNALGTFVHAGTHQGVLIENGTGTVYYDASGSFNLVGSDITYQWYFESGTPSTSTAETPGWVNYHTPGDYVTRLVVTSANGSIDTAYRYISVRDKMGEGSKPPIVRWTMGDMTESVAEGGASVEFTVFDQVNIMEGSIIILASDDWYGNNHVSMGGNVQNSENIFFVGFVDRGSIRFSAFDSSVSFTASSITALMKRATGFSVSVESKVSAVRWYELLDMDVRRAIYHYLKWHSTALSLADFRFVGDDRKIQFFDADRGSLFDAIDNLMRGTLYGTFTADRQGNLWAEVHPQAYDDPTGTFVPEFTISGRDWKDRPTVEERYYDESSYLELGGIAYSGPTTGTYTAHLADAPGGSPSRMGSVDASSGLAITGQTQLNSLVGHVWANKNCEFPSINMAGAIGLRNLGIAPYKCVQFDLSPQDTIRGERIVGLYFPSSITWRYDPSNSTLLPDVTFTRLVNGNPGDTIYINSEVPDEGFEFPDFDFPDFPALLPISPLALYDPSQISNLIIAVKDQGIFYTEDFDSPYPTWYPMNLGLPSLNARQMEVTASGKLYFQYALDSIWVAPYFGAIWTKLFDTTMIGNPGGYAYPRGQQVSGFAVDRKADDTVVILGALTVSIFGDTTMHMWAGSQGGVSLLPATAPSITFDMDGSNKLSFITRGSSGWLFTYYSYGSGRSLKVSDSGVVVTGDTLWQSGNTVLHTRSPQATLAATLLYHPHVTFNDGSSWNDISGTPIRYGQADGDEFQSLITNNDGTQMVLGVSSASTPNGLLYSLDSGATWITGAYDSLNTYNVSSVWHLESNAYVFAACGGSTTKIIANYDLASGTVYMDKTGNLGDLITGTFYPTIIRHFYSNE